MKSTQTIAQTSSNLVIAGKEREVDIHGVQTDNMPTNWYLSTFPFSVYAAMLVTSGDDIRPDDPLEYKCPSSLHSSHRCLPSFASEFAPAFSIKIRID